MKHKTKLRESQAKYYQEHVIERWGYNKEYYQSHKDAELERAQKYRDEHKLKIKEYRRTHKEKIKEYARLHKEERKIWLGEYNKNHITDARNRSRKYRSKHKTEPAYILRGRIKTAIRLSLKGNKNGRKWEDMVGYTLDELKQHLEKQFTDGMSWDNYGKWHIDHIVPKSVFNFSSPEHIDFKRCWSLSNLQPMWAKENMNKHAKLKEPFQPSIAL